MRYLEVLAIALALFIILRFVANYFPVLASRKNIRTIFFKLFPVVEMLAWLAYVFWALDQIFIEIEAYQMLIESFILVVVLIFGWYFLRDFVSGIILKIENAFEAGQHINTPVASGTIRKLGYRSMEIVTSEGEFIKIPFSRLTGENIVRPADTGNWAERVIKLKIVSEFHLEKIQSMLKNRILEMPWIVSESNIRVIIACAEEKNYVAEIHFYTISPEMAVKTEEILQVFVNEALS